MNDVLKQKVAEELRKWEVLEVLTQLAVLNNR